MTMGTSPFNLTQARYVSLVVQMDGCATTATSKSATLTYMSRRREKYWCRLLRPDSTSATWTLGSDGLGHVEVRGISHAPEPPISGNMAAHMSLSCSICGSVSAWELRWVAEGDECESDERFGVVEPERDLGERVDPGVGTGFGARRPH